VILAGRAMIGPETAATREETLLAPISRVEAPRLVRASDPTQQARFEVELRGCDQVVSIDQED
jgi:hypothetical protein